MGEREQLLKFEDVAERLNISVHTVRRMVADGRLRGVRVGRLWRVHPDELDRYVYEASRGGDDD